MILFDWNHAIFIKLNILQKDFVERGQGVFQFLNIAKASCGELKSMYYLSEDINYVTTQKVVERREDASKIMNGIGKFMQYLRKK